ncbi:MAG: coenzyme F420-0:L-glutamate ligase [Candidatus Hermodarchaeota archaeon]
MISIFALEAFPLIQEGDNIAEIIIDTLSRSSNELQNGDVLVIAHTIVSKAEGRVIPLDTVEPSDFAQYIAKEGEKDPRLVEIILKQANSIVRMSPTIIITETKHGFICANSGVDRSNVSLDKPGEEVVVLPEDPDRSAHEIRKSIFENLGVDVAVIISDTFGRPLRVGTTNVAIGCSGISPLLDYRGSRDLFGYELKTTIVARADELATAAGLVMGQAAEGLPVIIIRGAMYEKAKIDLSAKILNRPRETALFW